MPAISRQYIQCYFQNSRSLSKTGKRRTQMPIQIPQLLAKVHMYHCTPLLGLLIYQF